MWRVQGINDPVSQAAFPFVLLYPIGDRFSLTVTHTPAVSWWYEGSRLYGLSDTWMQGTLTFWDEKAMLNLGLGVPTGKTRLNRTEYEMTFRFLSRNIFGYHVPAYGQGLSGKVGLGFAFPISESFILGLGGQYLSERGAYRRLDQPKI